jgi:hypothetical protein
MTKHTIATTLLLAGMLVPLGALAHTEKNFEFNYKRDYFGESIKDSFKHGLDKLLANASLNTVCMQNAFEKEETSIISAQVALNTATINALTVRKDEVKAALAKPTLDEKKTALKAAYTKYNDVVRVAHKAMQTARTSAWTTFGTDVKACKA